MSAFDKPNDAAPTWPARGKNRLWIALLTAASLLFSLTFACATPFAALASLAAVNMRRRDAVILVGSVWLINQMVGYGLLHYPHTASSYTWGVAIGIAAFLALAAGSGVAHLSRQAGWAVTLMVVFAGALVAYEGALYATALLMGSGDGAFSATIVLHILKINMLAVAGLMALHRLGVEIGLVARHPHAFSPSPPMPLARN